MFHSPSWLAADHLESVAARRDAVKKLADRRSPASVHSLVEPGQPVAEPHLCRLHEAWRRVPNLERLAAPGNRDPVAKSIASPSSRNSSMIAGGGWRSPVEARGIDARPRHPSSGTRACRPHATRPDGWAPPLTSTLASPSAGAEHHGAHGTATSRGQLVQLPASDAGDASVRSHPEIPRRSSRIWNTPLSCRPSFLVKRVRRSLATRYRPPS